MICDSQNERHETLVRIDNTIPTLIADAEELCGERMYDFTFRETLFAIDARAEGVEVDDENQQPFLRFYPDNEVRIFITSKAQDDLAGAFAESAHEVIHSISPLPSDLVQGKMSTVLEEGLATFFQAEILKHASKGQSGLNPALWEYIEALKRVDQLLHLKVDAIIELRKKQPIIALITEEDILEVIPDLPLDVARDLVKPLSQLKAELSSHYD